MKPAVIDWGTFTVTTTRAVFVGAKESREWARSKLIGYHQPDPKTPWTAIAVSNRQKLSGVLYTASDSLFVKYYLQLGPAAASDTVAQFLADLQRERDSWTAHRPTIVVAPTATSAGEK